MIMVFLFLWVQNNSLLIGYAERVDRPTYTGSDVPSQDVSDNQHVKPPAPSAPPPDMFAQYSGYENTQFGNVTDNSRAL